MFVFGRGHSVVDTNGEEPVVRQLRARLSEVSEERPPFLDCLSWNLGCPTHMASKKTKKHRPG